jgi:hypothetical protein
MQADRVKAALLAQFHVPFDVRVDRPGEIAEVGRLGFLPVQTRKGRPVSGVATVDTVEFMFRAVLTDHDMYDGLRTQKQPRDVVRLWVRSRVLYGVRHRVRSSDDLRVVLVEANASV